MENPIGFLIIPVEILFLLLELCFPIEFYGNYYFLMGFLKVNISPVRRDKLKTKVVNHSLENDLLFDIVFYLQCFIFKERIVRRIFPLIDVHSILCKTDNTMFSFTLKSMTWIRKTYIVYS